MRQVVFAALEPEPQLLRGVIHLWSLDNCGEDVDLESLERDEVLGCLSTLHLVQALADSAAPGRLGLWLLTRGGQMVGEGSGPVNVGQSLLWGMGKVISLEQPHRCRCVRVDLDPSADVDEAVQLAQELTAADGEDQVAYRQGTRHVPRLLAWK
jgi:hypothetical protein